MGIESFGVFYIAERGAGFDQVKKTLISHGIVPRPLQSNDEVFSGILSPDFPVEVQAVRLDTNVTKFSYRFALANPPAIDEKFLDLVQWSCDIWPGNISLMLTVEMNAVLKVASWKTERFLVIREIELQRATWFSLVGGEHSIIAVTEASALLLKRLTG